MWALLLTVLLSAAVKGRRLGVRREFDFLSKSEFRRAVVAQVTTPIIWAGQDGKALTGADLGVVVELGHLVHVGRLMLG